MLFIHGILESPDQFSSLIRTLGETCTIRCLLLPGHGGTARDFAHCSMEQWRGAVRQAAEELRGKYPSLYLAGHSMGALLALEETAGDPRGIAGLFLMAAPLFMKLTPSGARNGLCAAFCRTRPKNPLAAAARDACSVRDFTLSACAGFIPRYLELFAAGRRCRPLAERLSVPMLVFQSGQDEFVRRRSAQPFRRNPRATVRVLRDSRHYFYPPEDREELGQALLRFTGGQLPNDYLGESTTP